MRILSGRVRCGGEWVVIKREDDDALSNREGIAEIGECEKWSLFVG